MILMQFIALNVETKEIALVLINLVLVHKVNVLEKKIVGVRLVNKQKTYTIKDFTFNKQGRAPTL